MSTTEATDDTHTSSLFSQQRSLFASHAFVGLTCLRSLPRWCCKGV